MSTPIGGRTGPTVPLPDARLQPAGLAPSRAPRPTSPEDQKLRDVVRQLEGVFTEQLFKAMRETVPKDDGIVSGGSGEEIFTGLLDQHLAADTPTQWQNGLGEALYRQLRGRLAEPAAATDATSLDRMPVPLSDAPIPTAGDAGR